MSQWDEKSTVVENIQLPHTLLSRFDLIFLMLDPQDEQFDRRLATHLVSLYHQSQEDKESVYMVSERLNTLWCALCHCGDVKYGANYIASGNNYML